MNSPDVFLLKYEDGSIFGPLNIEKLKAWAEQALVSPLDKVSADKSDWVKAPMIPELHMDWLIEVSLDELYGPTTLGAVKEFLDAGEINDQTVVINCVDGHRIALSKLEGIVLPKDREVQRKDLEHPAASSIRASLQQRVRDLEEALLEERQYSAQLEDKTAKLESRIAELTGRR